MPASFERGVVTAEGVVRAALVVLQARVDGRRGDDEVDRRVARDPGRQTIGHDDPGDLGLELVVEQARRLGEAGVLRALRGRGWIRLRVGDRLRGRPDLAVVGKPGPVACTDGRRQRRLRTCRCRRRRRRSSARAAPSSGPGSDCGDPRRSGTASSRGAPARRGRWRQRSRAKPRRRCAGSRSYPGSTPG